MAEVVLSTVGDPSNNTSVDGDPLACVGEEAAGLVPLEDASSQELR